MPYYITEKNPKCPNWAVVKEDGELVACHETKESAIDQAVAISINEDSEFLGERAAVGQLVVGDFVSWDIYDPKIMAQVVVISGEYAGIRIYELEDDVYNPTDRIVIMNIFKLSRVQKPEMISGEMEEEDNSEEVLNSEEKEPAIILDIDNTLIRGGSFNQELIDYLNTFEENTEFIIITARLESDRSNTVEELAGFDYDELYMKPSAEVDSTEFKKSTAEALMSEYNLMIAIDDNADIRSAYRELGITAIHPNEIPNTPDEQRQVNLTPPAYMRAAARRGLEYYREGKGGSGLVDRTIREARAMAEGNVTADKWVRIRAWIARHLGDLDSPDANPSSPNYPSPGVVAHLLWGSGPSKASARRALQYAEGVVSRLEEENRAVISQESEKMAKIEQRTNSGNFELRQVESGDGMTFTGYAAVFNSPSEPLPFIEKIAPGAFRRSLRARNDIKLLWNHDTGSVLGSTRAGTLKLEEDNYGLRVTAVLPDTTLGRDVRTLIQRGDVNAMSFGFSVPQGGDSWNTEGTERTLKSVRIHEVSVVAFPAYTSTAGTTSVRSFDAVATRANVDADALADAMLSVEDGKDLTLEQSALLNKVIAELTPKEEADNTADMTALELKKKKIELLLKRL